jgi:hypothetical protein
MGKKAKGKHRLGACRIPCHCAFVPSGARDRSSLLQKNDAAAAAKLFPLTLTQSLSPLPFSSSSSLHLHPHPNPLPDKFYYLAKEQGFRSRAAFKLIQLNRKYDFFSGARAAMDLCAAPGGWLQVAVKYMPMSSTIVGVDLAPIKAIRGCTTFVDDITTQSCRAQLKRCTPEGVKYDIVMHDGED